MIWAAGLPHSTMYCSPLTLDKRILIDCDFSFSVMCVLLIAHARRTVLALYYRGHETGLTSGTDATHVGLFKLSLITGVHSCICLTSTLPNETLPGVGRNGITLGTRNQCV